MRFDELSHLVSSIVHAIKSQLIEIDSLSTGTKCNSVYGRCILRSIGVQGSRGKTPHILEVIWLSPQFLGLRSPQMVMLVVALVLLVLEVFFGIILAIV